jgi:hypothetical protein
MQRQPIEKIKPLPTRVRWQRPLGCRIVGSSPEKRLGLARCEQAALVLKQYLFKATAARPYFDATKDAPLSAFEGEAPRHPVFQITTVDEPSR